MRARNDKTFLSSAESMRVCEAYAIDSGLAEHGENGLG